jgi:enediyne biosynthesis protein E4
MAARPTRFLAWLIVAAAVGVLSLVTACSSTAPPTTSSPSPKVEEEHHGPPVFEDVTSACGVAFTYRNGEEAGHFAIIESLGGGVALFDFDGDGRLDLFLPGGGYYESKKVLGHPCKLYRNLGNFKFEDVTAKVGLDKVSFPYSHGAAAFDFDRDGWPDLLITGYSRLVLLHNEPDGVNGRRFVDVTKKAGLNDTLWSSTAAWGDLDGDGYPEIYVSHYGDWGFDTNHPTDCTYDGKTRDVCQPRRFKPLPHTLYHNNRDGTFTDVSEQVKLRKDGKGLGVLFVDVNNDARPDIYVANDTDDNFLYLNVGKRGELALKEDGLFSWVARDDRGFANGSMGIDAADYAHDGLPSLIVTNYENELPALYRNRTDQRGTQFAYSSQSAGVATIGGSNVSWGTGFFDYDLDGWEDLLIVSGHAIRFPTKIDRRQKPILMRNVAGKFAAAEGGKYFREPHNARGAAFGDLDNDGRIDVVVSHLNEPVVVLRNVAPTDGKHWVGIELVGEKHADLVGARVVVESAGGKQTRYVKGGASYASTNDPRLLFGLGGDAKLSKVTIHWPSGEQQEVPGLEPGAYWRITEGESAAKKSEAKKS